MLYSVENTFPIILSWYCWRNYQLFPLQLGDWLETSESDPCRRQILTYKIDPRTVKVKIFLMAVDL